MSWVREWLEENWTGDDEPGGSEPAADEEADRAAGREDDARWAQLD